MRKINIQGEPSGIHKNNKCQSESVKVGRCRVHPAVPRALGVWAGAGPRTPPRANSKPLPEGPAFVPPAPAHPSHSTRHPFLSGFSCGSPWSLHSVLVSVVSTPGTVAAQSTRLNDTTFPLLCIKKAPIVILHGSPCPGPFSGTCTPEPKAPTGQAAITPRIRRPGPLIIPQAEARASFRLPMARINARGSGPARGFS